MLFSLLDPKIKPTTNSRI